MKNIPLKYHAKIRQMIKKAREDGYKNGKKDGIIEMAKHSKNTLIKLKSAYKKMSLNKL
jgi:hypothetical protein